MSEGIAPVLQPGRFVYDPVRMQHYVIGNNGVAYPVDPEPPRVFNDFEASNLHMSIHDAGYPR